MFYNSSDICDAYYIFACDWHGYSTVMTVPTGYGLDKTFRNRPSDHSDIECQLSRMGYKPACNLTFETLTENGKFIYAAICDRFSYPFPTEYSLPE